MDSKLVEALDLLQKEQDLTGELGSRGVKKTISNALNVDYTDEKVDQSIKLLKQKNILEIDESGSITVNDVDEIKEDHFGSLQAIYDKYGKYYHIEDTKKIDLLMATALSVGTHDKNIWILYVGASGIGKSMLTDPLRYVDNDGLQLAYMVSDMTTNTLVSGMEMEGVSLAPKLDGKIMYIPDFSTIVEKRSEDQREIFSQFRNLYDGFAKKDTGGGGSKEYDVDTTVLGNVTPAIHNKNLIHQSMGTRFLYYEINDFAKKEIYESIWDDSDGKSGDEISKEIGSAIEKFLNTKRGKPDPEVPEDVKERIEGIAEWTSKMRASGHFDRRNNELRGSVTPEKPTRMLKQFKKIYYNLKKLGDDYSDERALAIIRRIGASCVNHDKRQLYIELDQGSNGLSLGDLVDRMGLSRNSLKRMLLEMRNVGIIDGNLDMTDSGRLQMDTWTVTEEYSGLSDRLVNSS